MDCSRPQHTWIDYFDFLGSEHEVDYRGLTSTSKGALQKQSKILWVMIPVNHCQDLSVNNSLIHHTSQCQQLYCPLGHLWRFLEYLFFEVKDLLKLWSLGVGPFASWCIASPLHGRSVGQRELDWLFMVLALLSATLNCLTPWWSSAIWQDTMQLLVDKVYSQSFGAGPAGGP